MARRRLRSWRLRVPGVELSGEAAGITDADRRAVRKQADVAPDLPSIETREREESLAAQIGERKLRELYGLSLLGGLGAQILVANLMFLGYAEWGVDWKIDRYVMGVWLTATVAEVIAVVTVVTRSLFPTKT